MVIDFGLHSITSTSDGQYRAYYQSCWWIGDYVSVKAAKEAIRQNDLGNIKGRYAGYIGASDEHILAVIGNDFARAIAAQPGASALDGVRWMCPVSNSTISAINASV